VIRFFEREGVDFEETFASVAIYASIKFVISITSVMWWRIYQMDVKTSFPNGII
jgi:hypothetical protein